MKRSTQLRAERACAKVMRACLVTFAKGIQTSKNHAESVIAVDCSRPHNATHQRASKDYNEDNMEHLTPERHYMFHIRAAQTIDRLNEIKLDIDYDKWEEVEYTKDADAMEMLRYEWASRKNELTEESK